MRYWNAWLYIATLFVSIFLFGAYLYKTDKELLQKRLNTKEKEKEQKAYVILSSISFLATFCISGLDYRFGWSDVSLIIVIIALLVFIGGYGLFVITIMHNRFASRTVEVQSGQKVIDTGVYAIVRHPMYIAAIILFISSPAILGSYFAIIPTLFLLAGIVLRIKNEESVLCVELDGYTDYMKKVRYRLIPFVW